MASIVVYLLTMAACLSAGSAKQDEKGHVTCLCNICTDCMCQGPGCTCQTTSCSPFNCSQWCIFGYVEVNGCPTCRCCTLPPCPPPSIDVCPRGFRYVNGCPSCLCY